MSALRALVVAAWVVGCAGSTEPPAGEAAEVTAGGSEVGDPPEGTGGTEGDERAGPLTPMPAGTPESSPPTSFEAPLKVCGALESYRAVSEWRCPDGSMPLGGDPAAGQRARMGSSHSHLPSPPTDPTNAHIVDIYKVPCPFGEVTVYVCLYHCPPGRTPYD